MATPARTTGGKIKAITSISEKTAIKRLKIASIDFPDTLWLFSASGTLYVMKKKNGERVVLPDGGMNPNYIVDVIDIESDGGDW